MKMTGSTERTTMVARRSDKILVSAAASDVLAGHLTETPRPDMVVIQIGETAFVATMPGEVDEIVQALRACQREVWPEEIEQEPTKGTE